MQVGLEVLLNQRLDLLRGKKVGLAVNQASVDSNMQHAVELFFHKKEFHLASLFAPEHGIWGNLQDQTEFGHSKDPLTGLPVFSLYGETRAPTEEMLGLVDILVFDVQDVGTRVYTFIYTMAYCMKACRKHGKRFIVLDRPNPINGIDVEGNVLEWRFSSFVGLFPIPMRHGMTIGELALMFNKEFGIGCDLQVVRMDGWRREMWFDETGLPWVAPSPNMPTLTTATVYPGTVLVEGTNLSEGRGTTRPFELIGAPWIDPHSLAEVLNEEDLPGVFFRPTFFQPTFQKWQGETCGGVQIHVVDRRRFKPYKTGIALLMHMYAQNPKRFQWKSPPYEYEERNLPFDILCGTDKVRHMIEAMSLYPTIEVVESEGVDEFLKNREKYLLY
jgi:uncharacterized protein YbbC (DUF1343 family)